MKAGGPAVVALGGGHGLAVTLSAARRYAATVTAVVSVADNGGSSGRLREAIGIPAPGDLRRCLGALADPTSVWAHAFEYRFGEGGELAGHAFGNLLLAVLTEVTGDFATAIEHAARLLRVEGRVLPATTVPVDLVATLAAASAASAASGGEAAGAPAQTLVGQTRIARSAERIERLSLSLSPAPSPEEALGAVRAADQVIFGPGSLYTSVLAASLGDGLRDAIAARAGGRVFVANVLAVEPESGGYRAHEQLRVLLDHGVAVDTMLYDPSTGEPPVGDLGDEVDGVRCVAAGLGRHDVAEHDPVALAAALAGLWGGAAG